MSSAKNTKHRRKVVRFAGDSGDGIQIQGQQFTLASAAYGFDLATLPDFPAEIRAPVGTRFGVSAFQIQFGGERITTPGDAPDVLVAFNPAALITNIDALAPGAMIIVDESTFTTQRLKRAELDSNPLTDGTLKNVRVKKIDISGLTAEALSGSGLGSKDTARCKNFWVLGLILWMFGQSREPTIKWLSTKFSQNATVLNANITALNAGHIYGEAMEAEGFEQQSLPRAPLLAAEYRTVTGAEALSLGLVAASEQAGLDMMFCSYPITPASSLLHHLAGLERLGISTFQAEDEISAVCSAIGASFAGKLGITSSSGPGIALKTEAIGLAVATELPLLIINSQRAGPSTGMPTKTEQSDLYQAIYGRNADTPVPVIATKSPADCFDAAIEAVTIALRHMTPVFLMTDAYIANASELWPLPDLSSYPKITTTKPDQGKAQEIFSRNPKTFARVWATPGDANHMHRIGGIETDINTGHISYEPDNHQAMTNMRFAKVASVATYIPKTKPDSGGDSGVALVTWGSTYGAAHQAVRTCLERGFQVGHFHLRHLNPLPQDLGEMLATYDHVLVAEINNGQLLTVIRDQLLIDAQQLNQVTGRPFSVSTITAAIKRLAESSQEEKVRQHG